MERSGGRRLGSKESREKECLYREAEGRVEKARMKTGSEGRDSWSWRYYN